ncbi:uncharacterized protein [Procambarus clarkii]|uniref:uncharacterized protein isoform X1 n=1 Tax=Procambarus clarkii TaxID=6728 RepID=UPI0037427F35
MWEDKHNVQFSLGSSLAQYSFLARHSYGKDRKRCFQRKGNMSSLLHVVGRSMSAARVWRPVCPILQRLSQQRATPHLSPFSSAMPLQSSHRQPHMNEAQELKWLHPGDGRVEDMIAMNKHGIWRQGGYFTFHLDQPFEPHQYLQALTHLHKKVQLLRTCFRPRDKQWWLCEMPIPSIDFQVVEGSDPSMETQSLINMPTNLTDGPLWRVRLLKSTPEALPPRPEINEKFQYQNTVLIDFQHSAFDGVDIMMFIVWFHKVIDDMLSGKPIDDSQLGQLADHSQTSEITQQIKLALENDPERLSSLLKLKKQEPATSVLIEALGAPEPSQAQTKFLEKVILDVSDVDKFHAKCQSENISFNAGFTSVINTALVEVVREAGLTRDAYNIRSRVPIDTRRYMKGYSKTFPMGFHGTPMYQTISTPYNVKDNFWMYAKQYDVQFHNNLKNKLFIEDMIIDRMLRPADFSPEKFFANPQPITNDYFFVNMFTPLLRSYGVGKHIVLTDIRNIANIQGIDVPFLCILMKIRDAVQFDLHYSSRGITKNTAQNIIDKTVSIFSEICKNI